MNAFQIFMQIERTIRRAQAGRITDDVRDDVITALHGVAANHGIQRELEKLLNDAAARDAGILLMGLL